MIAFEQLAALPGAVALAPASVWIAAAILAGLAAVIAVRIARERRLPVKGGRDVQDETFRPGILSGATRPRMPEKTGENPERKQFPGKNPSGCSREQLP
ncbi:hypothetical protein [Methanoregula sp. UBA64]|jgi:hypothetical protein|uniref:hypothetical protein n=1 Tax=Methanoregula sp. UBA64 TaxID=1915554 RepID=UPI0025D054E2|nr:hypothetical protein [Methanoregula sp. UBA64]